MTQAVTLAQAGNSNGTFRNKIINGAMMIAQRGTGTTSTGFVNQVDQFQVATNAMSFTFGQSSSAPAGFTKSALVTNTSAVTPSGAQYYSVRTLIEGQNLIDLAWGTSSAKTVTLSFWVNSSIAGTYGGSFLNGSSVNYCYPFTYTINTPNTWEYKSVTIVGPTTGTWAVDTNAGIMLEWSLGCGSNYSGTAGAWVASRVQAVTGQTQWSATNGATFYITGVQLEIGTVPTAFELRSYTKELLLCQRYYFRKTSATVNIEAFAVGIGSGGGIYCIYSLPVAMRVQPSCEISSASHFGTWPRAEGGAQTIMSSLYGISIAGSTGNAATQDYRDMEFLFSCSGADSVSRFGFRSTGAAINGWFDASAEL